jgi:hypothetical protein
MDRNAVMAWVAAYEQIWRDNDVAGVRSLFTEDARYWRSPYEEPDIGHAGIEAFWPEEEGTTFTVEAEPVAVEGRAAVVRLEVHYLTPKPQAYRDLWILHFAEDGRVDRFEEWPFFPGRPYTART